MKHHSTEINSFFDNTASTNRLIAHAGGEINGLRYTNSLEAMNYSYSNGFRLFELDILKTSDNHYVAVHDWESWSKKTNYKGPLIPDKETFKQYRIHGVYTPMDMDLINDWFKKHPDAILVTDKINEPSAFASKFIDKNRLMMELFTWDAVNEAIEIKIKSAIPTSSLLESIEGDKVSFLKRLGIKDIAIDRPSMKHQKHVIAMITHSGINTYAFNIHQEGDVDEKYIMCNEFEYFYGVYADQWDFSQSLVCQ
jgi:lipoteichoic acid synthase